MRHPTWSTTYEHDNMQGAATALCPSSANSDLHGLQNPWRATYLTSDIHSKAYGSHCPPPPLQHVQAVLSVPACFLLSPLAKFLPPWVAAARYSGAPNPGV